MAINSTSRLIPVNLDFNQNTIHAIFSQMRSLQLSPCEIAIKTVMKVVILSGAILTGEMLGERLVKYIPGNPMIGTALGSGTAFTAAISILEKMDEYFQHRAELRWIESLPLESVQEDIGLVSSYSDLNLVTRN